MTSHENKEDLYIYIFFTYHQSKLWIVNYFIIWQGSLGVNPSVLIGSFLVGILPYGPFPWKWS